MLCVCLTTCYYGDRIKENKMSGAHGTYLGEKKNVLLGKPDGKRPLGSPRHRAENNLTVMWNLKE
jgi:hypothetical protein